MTYRINQNWPWKLLCGMLQPGTFYDTPGTWYALLPSTRETLVKLAGELSDHDWHRWFRFCRAAYMARYENVSSAKELGEAMADNMMGQLFRFEWMLFIDTLYTPVEVFDDLLRAVKADVSLWPMWYAHMRPYPKRYLTDISRWKSFNEELFELISPTCRSPYRDSKIITLGVTGKNVMLGVLPKRELLSMDANANKMVNAVVPYNSLTTIPTPVGYDVKRHFIMSVMSATRDRDDKEQQQRKYQLRGILPR